MDIDRLVGANLRKMRKSSGLTQEGLAGESGISPQHLSRIERGVCSPTTRLLHKLARALDVEIERFFEYADADTMFYIYTRLD